MPFNGSGTYTLPGAALVTGGTVDAVEHNTFRNDVATALTDCITRDGQSPATANIPMGGFLLRGLGTALIAGDALPYEQGCRLADTQTVTGNKTFTGNNQFTNPLLVSAATLTGHAAQLGQVSGNQGARKNLKCSATGLSAVVTISADSLVVKNASGIPETLTGISLTPSTGGAVGANSLDTGAWAYGTWYAVYVMWNGTTTAALFSLSTTAPTLPTGYTHFARVGMIKTQAATNYNPLAFTQADDIVTWLIGTVGGGTNMTGTPALITGNAGSGGGASTAVFQAVSVSSYIPSTAIEGDFTLTANAANSQTMFSQNASCAGYASSYVQPVALTVGAAQQYLSTRFKSLLEGTNVYYWSNGGAGSGGLWVNGWRDSL